jgi:hypothetical protein
VAPSSSQELSGIQAQAAMAENDVGETVQTLKLAWISEGANKQEQEKLAQSNRWKTGLGRAVAGRPVVSVA